MFAVSLIFHEPCYQGCATAGLRHTSKHKSQASRRQVKPQSNTAALAGSMTDTEAGVIFINKAGQKLAGILNDTGSKVDPPF